MPIEVVGLGVLLALELGVAEPELVGVNDFETGVGGLSFCRGEKKSMKLSLLQKVDQLTK